MRVEQRNQTILARKLGVILVKGGLHYIRGNSSPYFSLTCSTPDGGGADHELILWHFPQFADLAALHLSDINGVPMHAVENGFYHMGGCLIYGKHNPVIWAHAASHFRITEREARLLALDTFGLFYTEHGGFLTTTQAKEAKARLAAWVDAQRPRWLAEADACIRRHGLVVYGDVGSYRSADDSDIQDPAQLAHLIADRIAEDRK